MEKKKRIKVVRIYLEDFRARKYEVLRVPRTTFNKSIKQKFDSWLALLNKSRGTNYTARILTGNHLCRFCGGFADGKDRDLLCVDCKSRFNVDYYKQIKYKDPFEDVPFNPDDEDDE